MGDIVEELVRRSDREPEMIFKSEQRNGASTEIDEAEKYRILERLLCGERKFGEFFERFGRFLPDSHLNWFADCDRIAPEHDPFSDNERFLIRAYIGNLRDDRNRSIIRNRRFAFVLNETEDFFDEYAMATRDPQLYRRLIGQYLSDDERNSQLLDANVTLFDLLSPETEIIFGRNQQKPATKRQLWGEMDVGVGPQQQQPTLTIDPDELADNRREFRSLMIERFLNGHDTDYFDYSRTDTARNVDRERNQDLEDAYFDAD